jgi:hypothetical protein
VPVADRTSADRWWEWRIRADAGKGRHGGVSLLMINLVHDSDSATRRQMKLRASIGQ